MYLIKTYVAPSAIEGNGVFAAEDIQKGKTVTKHTEGLDLVFTKAQFAAFPPAFQNFLLNQTYTSEDEYVLNVDHERFTNHSEEPNTVWSDDVWAMVAARDIKKGEEITCDYREFDEDWQWKLNHGSARKSA